MHFPLITLIFADFIRVDPRDLREPQHSRCLNSVRKFVMSKDFVIIAPSNTNSWEEEIKNPKKEK